ncbi:MAG: phosphoribosyltransferase [Methanomassiliicoccales archaeon]|nr:phosphoribosyltransferase [Methanomassiliicoccales archaeon]TFG56754.1 MAG: phosphoribosyltransferase [Methanomassiliicoccus sp.]
MDNPESFKCKLVTWDEIARWTEAVAHDIDDDGFEPTVVIGLTRGGWVPARLICDHLQVKRLYAVKTEHWGITANHDGKALLTQELNAIIEGELVLIVDDITDTGESLSLAEAHLNNMGPKEVRTTTLLHITHSKKEPDYYEVEIPKEDWTWFIFPWNLHEDLRTILPKTLYEPKTVLGVQQAFKDQFQIDIPEELLRRTIRHLAAQGVLKKKGAKWRKLNGDANLEPK